MKVIESPNAPAAIGTYSQAIQVAHTVYLSGQIPLDSQTMTVVSEDIDEQIEQVFKNLAAVCEAASGSLNHIVKLNVYLRDLHQFSKVNEAMSRWFVKPYPARAVIEVSGLPRDVQIEMDGIMVTNS